MPFPHPSFCDSTLHVRQLLCRHAAPAQGIHTVPPMNHCVQRRVDHDISCGAVQVAVRPQDAEDELCGGAWDVRRNREWGIGLWGMLCCAQRVEVIGVCERIICMMKVEDAEDELCAPGI